MIIFSRNLDHNLFARLFSFYFTYGIFISFSTGTICEITKIQNLPDGRFVITATAGQRFIIQQKNVEDSIDYAKVKYFCDEPEDLNNDMFNAASRRAYDHLSQYITSLNENEQDCIINALGPLPQYESNFSHFQHEKLIKRYHTWMVW